VAGDTSSIFYQIGQRADAASATGSIHAKLNYFSDLLGAPKRGGMYGTGAATQDLFSIIGPSLMSSTGAWAANQGSVTWGIRWIMDQLSATNLTGAATPTMFNKIGTPTTSGDTLFSLLESLGASGIPVIDTAISGLNMTLTAGGAGNWDIDPAAKYSGMSMYDIVSAILYDTSHNSPTLRGKVTDIFDELLPDGGVTLQSKIGDYDENVIIGSGFNARTSIETIFGKLNYMMDKNKSSSLAAEIQNTIDRLGSWGGSSAGDGNVIGQLKYITANMGTISASDLTGLATATNVTNAVTALLTDTKGLNNIFDRLGTVSTTGPNNTVMGQLSADATAGTLAYRVRAILVSLGGADNASFQGENTLFARIGNRSVPGNGDTVFGLLYDIQLQLKTGGDLFEMVKANSDKLDAIIDALNGYDPATDGPIVITIP